MWKTRFILEICMEGIKRFSLSEVEENIMGLYKEIIDKKEKVSVIGLGYVGMPIAVAFAKKVNVIGFDISKEKIELYKNGIDPT